MYVADWHADDGHHTVLVQEGRKHFHLVVMDFPVKHVSVSKQEGRHLKQLPYPLTKAVRSVRRFAKTAGITRGAKRMLKEYA